MGLKYWLIRMRWPLTVAVLLAVAGCLGVAALYALTRYVAPAIARATPPLACLYTQVIEQHKAPLHLLPPVYVAIALHGACAPARVTHYVTPALWGLAASIALYVLWRKPVRKIGATVWYWVQGVGRLAPGTAHGRAQWATGRERRHRYSRRRGHVPYLVGITGHLWWTRRLWLDDTAQNYNVLIVGKPGVGKSSSQFIANMVRRARSHGTWWQRLRRAYVQPSGVATDPKGEFYAKTGKVFTEHGYIVRCFDPYNPHGARYNPLAHMDSETDYHRFARIVLRHRGGKMDAQSKEPFWDDTAELTMVASMAHLNHVARRQGRQAATLKELRDFVGRPDYTAMQQELVRSVPLARRMATQFMENVRKKPELEGSIQAGLPLLFGFLDDERVVASTSGDDFDFEQIGEVIDAWGKPSKPWQIYYVLPPGREADLAPLTIALLDQIFDTLTVKVARAYGGTLPRPVIADLDEVGTIGHLGDLAAWMNTVRSVGVWLRLACQYFGQIVKIYGDVEAEAIAEACQTQIYFGGAMVQEHGAELVSKQVGKTTIVSRGVNASRDREEYLVGQGGHTRTEQQAALMESDDFLRLPEHHMVIVPRHARPIKARAVAAEQAKDVRPYLGGVAPTQRPAPPATPEREPHVFAAPGVALRARPIHDINWGA